MNDSNVGSDKTGSIKRISLKKNPTENGLLFLAVPPPVLTDKLAESHSLDSEAGDEPKSQSEGDHWRGPAPAVEEKSR